MKKSCSRQMVFKLLYVHRKLLSPKTVVRLCPSPNCERYMVVTGISLITFLAFPVNGSEDQYQTSAARVSGKRASDYSHWIQENAVVHSCW